LQSMNLKKLHEAFIEKANRPMDFGGLPVTPKEAETPVMAVERWRSVSGELVKRYTFRREGDRDMFVHALLEYEREVRHNAVITITADAVSLNVSTEGVDHPTELDKEYSRFADLTFRDVVYSPDHGHQG